MNIYEFLGEVALNNNRPWLAAHRADYDRLREQWMADLARLIDSMARWEPGMARIRPADASYRFYRDTRFSTDKSPFKLFFSAALSPYGKKTDLAAYYLQIDCRADENGLYGGLWCPSAAFLRKMRHGIVDNIEEWEELLALPGIEQAWPGWVCSQPALKTAPAGWPKDHPQIEYLRLRDYGKFHRCSRQFFLDPSWPEMASEEFCKLKPFVDFINYTLQE